MNRSIACGILTTVALLILAAALPTLAAAQTSRAVEVTALPGELTFDVDRAVDALRLRVGGPGDLTFEERREAPGPLFLGLRGPEGEPLPDGLYSYELRGRVEDREVVLRSGFFSIRDGAFVSPAVEEEPATGTGVAAAGPARLAEKDQVFADDVIVRGSLCVGLDCVNNESFGFTTIRLKENNLRIEFTDTSTLGGFPTTDWQIRANESASGGAGLFAIDNVDAATTPFTVLAFAPHNSLFVDAQGDVGFGTSVPVLDLHALDGNTPGLRLEQDGSSGFSAQTWDVAGNEVSFFIRDVTNGARIPFRIYPGSPTSSLVIRPAGVGIGVSEPTAALDVAGSVAVSGTVDGRDVSVDGATLDAHVADFDNPHQVTAAQVGAEPAGAFKSGIVPAASFAGSPATATVTFATPYPAGTSYAVLLTSVTSDGKTTHAPSVLAKDETGFTVTLGNQDKDLVEVDWLTRTVSE